MIFTVKTTGVCQQKPNQIKFTLSFVQKSQTYNGAVEELAKQIIAFHKMMRAYAKPEDFKTYMYNVSKENKRVERPRIGGGTEYEYIFSHFEGRQTVTWEFPYNKVKLFEILSLISGLGEDAPQVQFVFGLNDEAIAALENQATEKAITLAKEKAESVKRTLAMNTAVYKKASIVEAFETYRERNSDMMMETAFCSRKSRNINEMAESVEPQDVVVKINVISEFELA